MKLFSSILKQKRTMTLVLLFLVVVGVVIPYVALADWNPICWEWLWGKSKPGNFYGDYCYFSGQNNQAVLDKLGDPIKAVFTGMILAVATIMIVVAGSLATLASNLFSTILGASTTMCYTCFDNPAIAAGWPMVRDLANMFIVLGFVVIGIATTLRIQEYQAKKTLFPLIIAALLINFSLLITGVFIDASNIAMTSFSKGGGFLATSVIGNISNQTSAIWNNWDPNQSTNAIGTAVGIVFYDIVLFVVFMLFFFLFLFRYIALWILVILSPLAFVCWVFPFTKKFFEMWWSNFLGWCIIGIPAGLFLWISDKIASNFISNDPGANPAGIAILGYLVPAMFLIAGFLFSLQTSAMGASMAIGAFKKTGKFAGAGAAKLTSLATEKSGATRGLNAMKSGATRMGERIGLVKPGTTAANQQASAKKEEARYEALFAENPEALKNIVRGRGEGRNSKNRAAATNVALKNQAFDTTDNAMVNALPHFTAHGYSMTEHSNKNPNMAQYDKNITDPLVRGGMSQENAARAAVMGATKKMGVDTAGNLSASNLTPVVVSAFDDKKAKRLGEKGSYEAIEEMKKYKHDPSTNLAGQSSEWRKARLHVMKSGPVGSPERTRAENQFASLQKQLATDANFA